ncbi:MAG TPA: GIY-YIG nuclease family protein [Stellaceae bacterium]|jgi:hypothetical protein|nr:GIY-YIG nuclease family protein [Stellaceae bacterium]
MRASALAKVRVPRPTYAEGLIYFARSGNHIKIGFCTDAHRRPRSLQTSNPEPIALIGTVPGTRETERGLHERFKNLRVRGEWFIATRTLLRFIARVAPTKDVTTVERDRRDGDGPENWPSESPVRIASEPQEDSLAESKC